MLQESSEFAQSPYVYSDQLVSRPRESFAFYESAFIIIVISYSQRDCDRRGNNTCKNQGI